MAITERIIRHPILPIPRKKQIKFYFNGKEYTAHEGEVISSALFANGISLFGHHYLDGSPQGIFCANGQCSQCLVIADGLAVKACMTPVREKMHVLSCEKLPDLPEMDMAENFKDIETKPCEVLIVGGGPSGVAAALELGALGHSVILADDRNRIGGKLVLQTHTFFGSIEDCYAGTRGIDIATILEANLKKQKTVEVMLNATVIGIFSDKKAGILQDGKYFLVECKKLLVATGAREKALSFPGWDLPGVYGAGAFQTLLNRDLVKPSERLFIIGGGNVGLIAAYHAMQANITVVGLAEALPEVSGYKVHKDKVARLGLPIYLSHSVLRVDGDERGVKTITIVKVDENFKPVPETEKVFEVDTVLVAVGLNPISELYQAAKAAGLDVYSAGDAKEIAEASAAIFGGKIAGLTIAASLGDDVKIPPEWSQKEKILKSKPGRRVQRVHKNMHEGVFPVFHCNEEIPCNPCTDVCPHKSIIIEGDRLLGLPYFKGKCSGCAKCVAICPGLAVTLVDFRKSEPGYAQVTIPFELLEDKLNVGSMLPILDAEGNYLTDGRLVSIKSPGFADRTLLITLKVPAVHALAAAGVRIQLEKDTRPVSVTIKPEIKKSITICNCMRVNDAEIRERIRSGVMDLNQLKAELNCGMGACGGKTCEQLILRIYREEGINPADVIPYTQRPPNVEIPLGVFAGI